MDQISKEELKDLLTPGGGQCISLYLPTHRAPVEGRQDLILFKNMIREAEERLVASGLKGAEAKEFAAPLQRLLDDAAFWQYRGDGLAVFYARGSLRTYRLPMHFEAAVVVASRFHLKPLIPLLAEESGFYVLALSQNEIRLLEGNRYSAWEVELEHIPASLAEAIQYDAPERQLQFRSRSGASGAGQKQSALFFAHGVGGTDNKDDIRRYFHQIAKGLQEVLRQDHVPLILAGVEYLLPLYREVNVYPHLLTEGIPGSPELLSTEELQKRAWKLVQPRFAKAQQEVLAQYRQLAGTGRTARDLREIVPAASGGRIEKLIVAEGGQAWGRYVADPEAVEMHAKPQAGSEDLLDLAAVLTAVNGGLVYAVAQEALPENGPAVALFRY
ncbi:MAG: hypothetical protein M0009_00080 [Deltaproteobacteria bacterium]|nr:hypothetical protein [Deltaproteobacteria bacterium]